MNILYKYCDRLGTVKILESLELKLPYISDINDPNDCWLIFYCPNDKIAFEERYLETLKNRKINLSPDAKQKIDEQFEKGEIQNKFIDARLNLQKEGNKRDCLLSVSGTAKNVVMWAHYAERHKGMAIGIDFDDLFPSTRFIMTPIEYSKERPRINVLASPENSCKEFEKAVMTKSSDWEYEQEFRTLFLEEILIGLKQKGLARLKNFNGKQTWFLRVQPKAIKEIIFGLHVEESSKLAIIKLTERTELQHVKLYKTEESDTYTLNLVGLDGTAGRYY